MKELLNRNRKLTIALCATFLILTGAQMVSAYPSDGLMAAYLFNGNPNDSSGNGNHGTVYGATTLIADRFGNANSAYRFTGKEDYIIVPGMALTGTSFTISAWVRTAEATPYGQFLRRGNHANYILEVRNTADYPFSVWFTYSADPPPNYHPNRIVADNVATLNEWMLVTGVYDRKQGMTRLFVNGALAGENPAALDPHDPGGSLEIGNWYGTRNGWNYVPFTGDVDDVLIYTRPLSDSEIQGLYYFPPVSNQPPVANAGPDEAVECTGVLRTAVELDGSSSYDPDDDPLACEWYFKDGGRVVGCQPSALLPLGVYPITLVVADRCGATDDDEVVKSVVDTTAPQILSVAAYPDVLWPPNHKMKSVSVEVASLDVCDHEPPVCRIVSVASNEPQKGLGDGDAAPDWVMTGDLTADLRAERSGTGNGRIYTLEIACEDASGNVATSSIAVSVPHDRK